MLTTTAYTQAYRHYADELRRMVRRFTNYSADSEDVAQEAWVQAWKDRDGIDPARIFGWLYAVAKRKWWAMLNRRVGSQQKYEPVPAMVEFDVEKHDEAIEPAQEEAASAIMLHRAIDRMGFWAGEGDKRHWRRANAQTKRTAHMVASTGVMSEVAKVRSVTPNAIESTMAKVVQMLRQQWGVAR